jgi:hypothetical protein
MGYGNEVQRKREQEKENRTGTRKKRKPLYPVDDKAFSIIIDSHVITLSYHVSSIKNMINPVKEQVDRRRLNKEAELEPVESPCVDFMPTQF